MSASSGSSENLQCHGTVSQDLSQCCSQSGGRDTSGSETSLDTTVASRKSREILGVRFNPDVSHHPPDNYDRRHKLSKSKSGKKKKRQKSSDGKKSTSGKLSDVEILKTLCEQVLDNARVATPSVSRRGSTRTGRTHSEGSLGSCDQRRDPCLEQEISPDSQQPRQYSSPDVHQAPVGPTSCPPPFDPSDPPPTNAVCPPPSSKHKTSAPIVLAFDSPGDAHDSQSASIVCPLSSRKQRPSTPTALNYNPLGHARDSLHSVMQKTLSLNAYNPPGHSYGSPPQADVSLSSLKIVSLMDRNDRDISSVKGPPNPADKVQHGLLPSFEDPSCKLVSFESYEDQHALAPARKNLFSKLCSNFKASPREMLSCDDLSSSPGPEDYCDAQQETLPPCTKPCSKPSEKNVDDDPCSNSPPEKYCDALAEIPPSCDDLFSKSQKEHSPQETSPLRIRKRDALKDYWDVRKEMVHQLCSETPSDCAAAHQKWLPSTNLSGHNCNVLPDLSLASDDSCNKPHPSDSCADAGVTLSTAWEYPYSTPQPEHFYASQQSTPQSHIQYFSPQPDHPYSPPTQPLPTWNYSSYGPSQPNDPCNSLHNNQVPSSIHSITCSEQGPNDSFSAYGTWAPLRKDTYNNSLTSDSSTGSEGKRERRSLRHEELFDPPANNSCNLPQSRQNTASLCKDSRCKPPGNGFCDYLERRTIFYNDRWSKQAHDDFSEDPTLNQKPYTLSKGTGNKSAKKSYNENSHWTPRSYCLYNDKCNNSPSSDPFNSQPHPEPCDIISSCPSIPHSVQSNTSNVRQRATTDTDPFSPPDEHHSSREQVFPRQTQYCGVMEECKPDSPTSSHSQSLDEPPDDNPKRVPSQRVFQDLLRAQKKPDFASSRNEQKHANVYDDASSSQHSPAESFHASKQRSSFPLDDPYDSLSSTGISRVSIKDRSSSPVLDPSYYFLRCTNTQASLARQGKPKCVCVPNLPATIDGFSPLKSSLLKQNRRSYGISPESYIHAAMCANRQALGLPDYPFTERQGKTKYSYISLLSTSKKTAPYRNTSQSSMSHTVKKKMGSDGSFVLSSPRADSGQASPRSYLKPSFLNVPCDSPSQTDTEPVSIKAEISPLGHAASATSLSFGASEPKQNSSDHHCCCADTAMFSGMSHSQVDLTAFGDLCGNTSFSEPSNRKEYEAPPYYPSLATSYSALYPRQESAFFASPTSYSFKDNVTLLLPTKQDVQAPDPYTPSRCLSPQHYHVAMRLSIHSDHASSASVPEVLTASDTNLLRCRTCGASSPTPEQGMRDPNTCLTSSNFRPTSPHTYPGPGAPDYCSLSHRSFFPANVAPSKQAGLCIPAWCFSTISNFSPNESSFKEGLRESEDSSSLQLSGLTANKQGLSQPINSYPSSQPSDHPVNEQGLSIPEDFCLSSQSSNHLPNKEVLSVPGDSTASLQPSNYVTDKQEFSVPENLTEPASQPSNCPASQQELSVPEDSYSVHKHSQCCSPNHGKPSKTFRTSHINCNSSMPVAEQQSRDFVDFHSITQTETCPHNLHSPNQGMCVHSWNNTLSANGGRVVPVPDVPVCNVATRQEHVHHIRPPDCILHAPSTPKEESKTDEHTTNCEVFLSAESATHGRECQPSPSFDQYSLYSWSANENYSCPIAQMSCASLSTHYRCCAACNTDLTGFCQMACSPDHHASTCNSPSHHSRTKCSHARAYGNPYFSSCDFNQNQGGMVREEPCRSPSGRSNNRIFAQQYVRVKRPKFTKSRTLEKTKEGSSNRVPSRKRINVQAPTCDPEESASNLPSRPTQDNHFHNPEQSRHQVKDHAGISEEKSFSDENSRERSCVTCEALLLPSCQENKTEEICNEEPKSTTNEIKASFGLPPSTRLAVNNRENRELTNGRAGSISACNKQADQSELQCAKLDKNISQDIQNHANVEETGTGRIHSRKLPSNMSRSHVRIDIRPNIRRAYLGESSKTLWQESGRASVPQIESGNVPDGNRNPEYRLHSASKRGISKPSADHYSSQRTHSKGLAHQERSTETGTSKLIHDERMLTRPNTVNFTEPVSNQQLSSRPVCGELTPNPLKQPSNVQSSVKVTFSNGTPQVRYHPHLDYQNVCLSLNHSSKDTNLVSANLDMVSDDLQQATTKESKTSFTLQPHSAEQVAMHSSLGDPQYWKDSESNTARTRFVKKSLFDTSLEPDKLMLEERVRHRSDAILQLSQRHCNVSLSDAGTQVKKYEKGSNYLKGFNDCATETSQHPGSLPQQSGNNQTAFLTATPNQPSQQKQNPTSYPSSSPLNPTSYPSSSPLNPDAVDHVLKRHSIPKALTTKPTIEASQKTDPTSKGNPEEIVGCCLVPEKEAQSVSTGQPACTKRQPSQASVKKVTIQIVETDMVDGSNAGKKMVVRALTPHPCSGRDLRYSSDDEPGYLREPEPNPAASTPENQPLHVVRYKTDPEDLTLEFNLSKVTAPLEAMRSGSCISSLANEARRANPHLLGNHSGPQVVSPKTVSEKHLGETVLSKTIVKSPSSKTIQSEQHAGEYVDIFPYRGNEYLSAFHTVIPSHESNPLSSSKFAVHKDFSAPNMSFNDTPYHLNPLMSYPAEHAAGTETRRRSSCPNIPASLSPNVCHEFKSTQTDCSVSKPVSFSQSSTTGDLNQSTSAYSSGSQTIEHRHHRRVHDLRPQLLSSSCPSHSGVFLMWPHPEFIGFTSSSPCWDCVKSHCHHNDFHHHVVNPHADPGYHGHRYPASFSKSVQMKNHSRDRTKDDIRWKLPEFRDSTTSPPSTTQHTPKESSENINRKVRKKKTTGNKRK